MSRLADFDRLNKDEKRQELEPLKRFLQVTRLIMKERTTESTPQQWYLCVIEQCAFEERDIHLANKLAIEEHLRTAHGTDFDNLSENNVEIVEMGILHDEPRIDFDIKSTWTLQEWASLHPKSAICLLEYCDKTLQCFDYFGAIDDAMAVHLNDKHTVRGKVTPHTKLKIRILRKKFSVLLSVRSLIKLAIPITREAATNQEWYTCLYEDCGNPVDTDVSILDSSSIDNHLIEEHGISLDHKKVGKHCMNILYEEAGTTYYDIGGIDKSALLKNAKKSRHYFACFLNGCDAAFPSFYELDDSTKNHLFSVHRASRNHTKLKIHIIYQKKIIAESSFSQKRSTPEPTKEGKQKPEVPPKKPKPGKKDGASSGVRSAERQSQVPESATTGAVAIRRRDIFVCKLCDSEYVLSSTDCKGTNHEHSKKDDFICGLCDIPDQTPEEADTLTRKLEALMHTYENPSKCEFCDVHFDLKKHLKTNHDAELCKRLKCLICNEIVDDYDDFKIHKTKHESTNT